MTSWRRHATDAEKHAFNFQFALGPVAYVAQPQSLYGQIVDAEHFVDYGVGAQLDIRMRDGTSSSMIFDARKASRRCSNVTLDAKRVRNSASSMAESPPPMTAIGLPRKKKPSHVAQLETP